MRKKRVVSYSMVLKRVRQFVKQINPKLLVTIAIFAVFGIVTTFFARALSPSVTIEPESGSITSPAFVGNDSTASGGSYVQFATSTSVTGTSYYVDCAGGSDSNNGTSQSTAWSTLTKVNAASLVSGDGLFFKRGCTWTGSLTVKWGGVTVGNYGSGAIPIFQSAVNNTNIINMTGSGNTIDGLQVNAQAPTTDANCGNTPVGHIVDFNFPSGSANNIVRNSTATGAYAGFYLNFGSHDNHILNNTIQNNIMMSPLDTTANNDAGAFGVLLWGNNNEIGWNKIDGSDTCSYDYTRDGSAVEVFNGSTNNVHNNTASQDNTFTELGKDSSHTSDGNTFAYNQFYSSAVNGIFLNTRGSGNSFGPITNTKAYNNIAYVTGASSPGGVICSSCDATILTLKNNIIWDNVKALYTSAAFPESNNIYWAASGSPLIQGLTISSTSKKVNPMWVNPGTDYHLQSGSPAIDAGTGESVTAGYNKDLDNHTVPAGSAVDIGSYESGSVALAPHRSNLFSKSLASAHKVLSGFARTLASVVRNSVHIASIWLDKFGPQTVYATGTPSSTSPCVGNAAPTAWKHVVVIMMENHTYSGGATPGVIGTKDSSGNLLAPYVTGMAGKCGSYTNWHDADYKVDGVTKDGTYVSKPNYATLTSGVSPTAHGLLDDTSSTTTGVDNIYNELNTHGKTPKDYYDASTFNSSTLTFTDNPNTTGCGGGFNGSYHDAIRYYTDLTSTYCSAHDVNISTFMNDVNGTLPDFSLVLPQNCHNMHSCSPYTANQIITNGDTWLAGFLPQLLDSARYQSGDTAVFVLWDEDTPIPNLLIAPTITAGSFPSLPTGFTNPFSHFSALRTWEEMLGLPLIGNTGSAPSLLPFYNGNCTSNCGTTDTQPPTTSITSPTGGSTVSGSISITATASDNVGVTKTELYVDGALKSTDTTSPYAFSLDTTTLSNANHTLQVKAYDAAGNVGSSSTITVTVANGCAAVSAPYGQVSVPINVTTAGTYHVWSRIMAPDTTNNSYTFQTDGACNVTIGDSSISSGAWTWVNYKNGSTTTPADITLTTGNHTVILAGREQAVKVDRVLLLSDTCVPTGTGDNCTSAPDTTAPTITITAPASGASVKSPISITTNATDPTVSGQLNSGVAKVDFYIDGVKQSTVTAPGPYNWSWSTTATGSHTIGAQATDVAGNVSSMASESVNLLDGTPPTVSITSPANGSTISGNAVGVAATAADNVGVSKVEFYVNNTLKSTDTSSPYSYTLDTTTYPNAAMTILAKAYDAAGNVTTSSTVNTTVFNDTTAPSAPTNLTSAAASATQVNLSWGASTDNVAVTKYQIQRNGVIIAQVSGTTTSYSDTTVAASTQYSYVVYAADGAGNTSPASNTTTVTTPSAPDTTPPSAPTGLAATAASGTQVNLTWTASTDTGGSGLKGYKIYRNGTLIVTTTTTSTSYGDATVSPGTTYTYQVSAYDGSGNESAKSNQVSVSTGSALTGDINNDGAVNITDLSILLSNWNTANSSSDLNKDGAVNISDLSILLSHWTG